METKHGDGASPKEADRGTRKRLQIGVAVAVVAVGAVAFYVGFFVYPRAADGPGETPTESTAPEMPEFDTVVARGSWVFSNRGCAVCHGIEGVGGVVNENYVLGTVPSLDEMADRLMLYGPEEAQAVIAMLEQDVDPRSRADDPPFDGYPRFLAQYGVVLGVIDNGATAAKADASGPEPPLQMPPWRDTLSDEDKRATIAYLVSLYDWEGEEDVVVVDDGNDPYADDEGEVDPYADDEGDPYADDPDEVNPHADAP